MTPRSILTALAVALTVTLAAPPTTTAQSAYDDLPEIGSPADVILTRSKAERIGRSVLMQMRQQEQIVEDPEVDEYINSIGHQLAGHAHDGAHSFKFFVVDDGNINAFALPGGYIGVNSGLILRTKREAELAGVMAHEVAHVTQNHIARRVAGTQKSSMLATAAILAAILMGATGNAEGDVIQATAMGAQALATQQAINYTRANEYEADRVGINILSSAGYDPTGMPDFFETMGKVSGSYANRAPEFLLTHPVSSTRMAETRGRAMKLPPGNPESSLDYKLIRERLRALTTPSALDAVEYYENRKATLDDPGPEIDYGLALAYMRYGDAGKAVPLLFELRAENDSVIAYHSAYGQALVASGQPNEGLLAFDQALALFPRNVPLTIRYAESLMIADQYDKAHAILLDLFNMVAPTPAQVKLIASAAGAAGLMAEAHYYMCEYYLLNGNVVLAVEQLNHALSEPGLQSVQRARFEARRNELVPYLPKNHPQAQDKQARG
jgi:predicted Zn-dependent protease